MNNLDTAACPGSLLGLYSDTYSQTSISSNLDSQIEYELLIGDQYEAFVGFISEFFIFGGSYCGLATEAHSLTICLGTEPDYLISSKGDSCQCGIYSCNSGAADCLNCDQSCDYYCNTTATDCLKIAQYCAPYAIMYGVCDLSVTYIQNCKTHNYQNTCDECETGYVMGPSGNICCLHGYYVTASTQCSSCHSSCAECTGSGQSECTSCTYTNLQVVNGVCSCSSASFISGGMCLSCLSECATCINDSSCTLCLQANFVLNVLGRCICPNKFYSTNDGFCLACDPNCLTCVSSLITDCLSCVDQNAEILVSPGSCICKIGFYTLSNTNIQCLPCNSICKSCTGSSQYDCSECSDPNGAIVNSICTCNQGYYENPQKIGFCLPCDEECLTCNTLSNYCTSCPDVTMEINLGVCKCLNSSVYNKVLKKCISCPELCQTCEAGNICLTCIYQNLKIIDGRCGCGFGAFWNSSILECQDCHSDCKSCSGQLQDNCILCQNISITSFNGRCSCKEGEFISQIDPLSCKLCHEDCLTCSSPDSDGCLTCKDTFMAVNNGSCECIN